MFRMIKHRCGLALAVSLLAASGCVTVSHEELASRSYLEGGALPSISQLEAVIRVDVVPLEEPAAEAGIAAAR